MIKANARCFDFTRWGIKTRIATWHVLSLYPGEPQLKFARRKQIVEAIEGLKAMGSDCGAEVKREISEIKSFWNLEETLKDRKKELREKIRVTVRTLAQETKKDMNAIERTDQLVLAHDNPTRILFQFDNGALVGAREG